MKKKHLLSFFTLLAFAVIAFGSDESKTKNSNSSSSTKSQSTSSEPKKSNPCYGDENCIGKVRSNFESTGKQILGEQYLGDGKFGISFLDANRGESYNADISTDCNCAITNFNVSLMR
jgi:hypothetical protein